MVATNAANKGSRASFTDVCTLESLFCHKWTALFGFLFGLGLTALVLFGRDRSFDSTARVFVRLGRESVTVDPTASASGQMVQLSDSQQREIQSVMDLLQSQVMFERVVDVVGIDQILDYSDEYTEENKPSPIIAALKGQVALLRNALVSIRLADAKNDRSEALETLDDAVKVSAEEDSNVIAVRVRGQSPKQSQLIANAMLTIFQDLHLKAHGAPGSYDFFQTQLLSVRDDLSATMGRLRDKKNSLGYASIEGQRQLLNEKIKEVELDISRVSSNLEGGNARVAEMEAELRKLPEFVLASETTGLTNTSRDEMRGQLYSLEVQLAELLSKYKPEHPLVVNKRTQIADAKSTYVAEDVAPQQTKAVNTIHQSLKTQYLLAQAEVVAATAQLKELQTQRESVLTETRKLNETEAELEAMQREIQVLDAKYRRYAENLEQARIDQNLQKDRLSSINVIQPPTFNEDPVDLSNTILAFAGLVGSVLLGLGGAFGQRYLRKELMTSADIERELRIPVLASVPTSRQRRVVFR